MPKAKLANWGFGCLVWLIWQISNTVTKLQKLSYLPITIILKTNIVMGKNQFNFANLAAKLPAKLPSGIKMVGVSI